MKVGLAIYDRLRNTSAVSDIVSTRIYPNVAPQISATFPFIVYTVNGVTPNDTKEGVSSLDVNDVMVMCYSKTYTQAADLADKVRTALDRIPEGTYNNVKIQSSQFEGYNDSFSANAGNEGIYVKTLDFNIRQIIP